MSYDGDSFTWEFKVDHFTRWGPDESEDEEQDQPMDEEEKVSPAPPA